MHYWGAYAFHGELQALFPPVWLEPMKTGKEGSAWTRQKPSTVALPRICEHTKEKIRKRTSPSDLAAWRPCLGASATPAHSTLKAKEEEAPDYTKEPKLKMKPTGFLFNKDALLLARLW